MITEQELKDQCTPDIIKSMVELAEGFEIDTDGIFDNSIIFSNGTEIEIDIQNDELLFPLLIHRAFTGASKKYISEFIIGIDHEEEEVYEITKALILLKVFKFENYQPSSLTPCECACLHCLIEIFKEERE